MLSAMKGYNDKNMKYDSVCKKWTVSAKRGQRWPHRDYLWRGLSHMKKLDSQWAKKIFLREAGRPWARVHLTMFYQQLDGQCVSSMVSTVNRTWNEVGDTDLEVLGHSTKREFHWKTNGSPLQLLGLRDSDITKTKYVIFLPDSWHTVPKTRGISGVKRMSFVYWWDDR